jgi:hypothetical protein
MDKKWDDLSPSEKIEDLRSDVKAIFQHLNELSAGQRALNQRLDGAASLASEVAKKVDALTRR